jgi:uncharacterized phage protein (TIGR01671 family)
MNTEIELRAWDTQEKVMNYTGIAEEMLYRIKNEAKFPKNRFIIMQSTGITDKKGNKIYAGDVRREDIPDEEHGMPDDILYFICVWVNSIASFQWMELCLYKVADIDKAYDDPMDNDMFGQVDSHESNRYNVIGNIYEKPELLKL